MNNTIQTILNHAANLSAEELIELNRQVIALYKHRTHVNAATAAAKFVPGQVIRFYKKGNGRYAGTHYIRIEGYNRAGTGLVGYECDLAGRRHPNATKWTVSASAATLVTPN